MEKQHIFDLAKRASAGDKDAFTVLLNEKSRYILYYCFDFMKNHHDAEDAAQEIAVKMYRYIGSLREPENFNAWLHSIIRSVCISKLRKSKHYKDDLDVETVMEMTFSESLIEKDREFLPHAFAEDRSLSEMLLEVIRELPNRRRKTIILYYYEDLSQKEISEIMGISESAVGSNLMRARRDIKEKLESKTGMDLEREMEFSSKVGVIPVLGQVLSADAAIQFGPESIARLTGINFGDTGSFSKKTPKSGSDSSGLGLKVAALVTTAGMVAGGIFVAADGAAITEPPDAATSTKMEQPADEQNDQEPAGLPADGEISFVGGDCDCGHENPSGITLIYDQSKVAGELSYKWELVDSGGGTVVGGEGKNIDVASGELSAGNYTAKFIITDKYGNILSVERDFVIK